MSIFGALERQGFIRELPVLADGVNQIGDGVLAILEGFANGVLNQPAFEVDCLPGRRRYLDICGIFEDPADFLKNVPGTFARCSGRFQLVEHILDCFRGDRHDRICSSEHVYGQEYSQSEERNDFQGT